MYVILVKNCFNPLFLLFYFYKIIFSSCFRLFVFAFFRFPLGEVILQILNRCSRSLFRGTETGSKVNDDIIMIKGQQLSTKNNIFKQFCFLLLCVCFSLFLSSKFVTNFRRFHSTKQARTCLFFLCLF